MYLGIDSGSVSMKAVILDKDKNIIDKVYLKNEGLITTLQELLEKLKQVEIKGVGITGSGKEFINILVGGDLLDSEIMSHSVGCLNYYPDAKTIMDIGGEDSKLMIINDGILYDFSLNQACGGGTGAMIETIANRLDIKIENVGDLALTSKNRITIASKCGIFAQSDVVSKLNKGVEKSDILMGICRGMVGNYFAMLGRGKKLEPPFIFQGATAKNKALIQVFKEELNDDIIIPTNPEYIGAIGIALLTIEKNIEKTNFKGFEIKDSKFKTITFIGNGCNNNCEITEIYQDDKRIGFLGNRCERCIK